VKVIDSAPPVAAAEVGDSPARTPYTRGGCRCQAPNDDGTEVRREVVAAEREDGQAMTAVTNFHHRPQLADR